MFAFTFSQYADLQAEIEEYKELAAGRLGELEKLMSDHETTKREVEVLKNRVRMKYFCVTNVFFYGFFFQASIVT